jgi:HD superfamily phosphohydrolase
MRKPIVHRDQVHGDVHYDSMGVALLDTEAMQRLGRIFQLGYAHLVFRGGTHTRLSHVMGASHMATEIVDSLRFNYAQKRAIHPKHVVFPELFLPCPDCDDLDARWDVLRHLVSWAALLHDLGHVPLGHTLEDEFEGIFRKHDDFSSPRSPYLWDRTGEIYAVLTNKTLYPPSFKTCEINPEQVWQTVMLTCFFKDGQREGEQDDFLAALDRAESGQFVSILRDAYNKTTKVFRPYFADIVANTICADYLDYLRRDPLNVGLDVLREIRVLSSFYVCQEPNKTDPSFRMALALVDRQGKPRLDVCTSVIELVRQRYRFAEIIYYHKAKVSASAMFAKAMNLIGTPPEVGSRPLTIYSQDVDLDLLAEKIVARAEPLVELRQKCLPGALMDTELGDESLHVLLMNRAFDEIAIALPNGESEVESNGSSTEPHTTANKHRVKECLRGIALLQAIGRRRLYKTCLSISAEQFGKLTQGVEEASEIEARLKSSLKRLRTDKALRDRLEHDMAAAAGWPKDSLLLYVPPRKSQAKGIETFAFNKAGVVRLGKHPAVAAKVQELGNDYQALWRLLLLVHPERRDEVNNLSKAVDVLVQELWTNFGENGTGSVDGVHEHGRIDVVQEAAWFPYIAMDLRNAAENLRLLSMDVMGNVTRSINWDRFIRLPIRTTLDHDSLAPEEYAQRSYIIERLVPHLGRDHHGDDCEHAAVELVKSKFPGPVDMTTYKAPPEVTKQFHYDSNIESPEQKKLLQRAFELDDLATDMLSERGAGAGLSQ